MNTKRWSEQAWIINAFRDEDTSLVIDRLLEVLKVAVEIIEEGDPTCFEEAAYGWNDKDHESDANTCVWCGEETVREYTSEKYEGDDNDDKNGVGHLVLHHASDCYYTRLIKAIDNFKNKVDVEG